MPYLPERILTVERSEVEEKRPLLKTVITNDIKIYASRLFPSVLSSLPVTLQVRIRFEGGIYFKKPTVYILAETTAVFRNKKRLYELNLYDGLKDESEVHIQSSFEGKRVKDIIVCYDDYDSFTDENDRIDVRKGKLHLEINQIQRAHLKSAPNEQLSTVYF